MTNGFSNILAIYDDAVGGDDVLVQAIGLARSMGARLTVANILGEDSMAVREEAQRRLRRVLPFIIQEGVENASTEVLSGTPHVEITRQVVLHDYDLVIASAEAGRGIKDIFLGSTAINLLRKCPSAVWIVKPGSTTSTSTVLAAVDVPVNVPEDGLESKVLESAAALARSKNSPLHVVSCWEIEGNESEMVRSEIRDTTKRNILARHKRTRQEALQALIARSCEPQLRIVMHLPRGAHHDGIIATAEDLEAGLVVMGTSSRLGLSALLMGNSVEIVLNAAPCGILAIKPESFRTPVSIPQTEMGRPAISADSR